jgi:phospholipid-binding lipoprotein MlaA
MLSAFLMFGLFQAVAAAETAQQQDSDFAEYDDVATFSDPFESFNRVIFTFNDRMHVWVLEPTARGYSKVTPSMFRTGIKNFFGNLMEPARFLNCLLQGRLAAARDVFFRFLLNSTAGVGGLMDPAGFDGLKTHDFLFASTLKTYGLSSGPYLVLPFLGPSDVRGVGGLVGDTLSSPMFWALRREPLAAVGERSLEAVNRTSFHLGEYQEMLSGTLDPYVAVRNAYLQYQLKREQ